VADRASTNMQQAMPRPPIHGGGEPAALLAGS
jgi:hypothetical protein